MIKGLQKITLIDYPDKVACTIFFAGCNFRCGYCYNTDLVFNSKKLKEIKEEEILAFLGKRKKWLDGVVIGGGEPTLNEELPDFLKKIKEMGFLVKLDTNGSEPDMLRGLIEKKLIDYAAMDIKAPLQKENYKKATGIFEDIDKIERSIELLINSNINYEFRTTLVPGVHKKEDILKIAKQIKGAKKYVLQRFAAKGNLIDKQLEKTKPYSEKEMEKIRRGCSGFIQTETR